MRSHNTYPLTNFWKWLYQTMVSLSPRHVKPLLYGMRDEQVCKTISISKRLVSLHINGDYNLESELELCIKAYYPNSDKVWSKSLDQPFCNLK